MIEISTPDEYPPVLPEGEEDPIPPLEPDEKEALSDVAHTLKILEEDMPKLAELPDPGLVDRIMERIKKLSD